MTQTIGTEVHGATQEHSLDHVAEPRWGRATLLAFRFVCVYFALQWLPLIVGLNTGALTGGIFRGPDWWGTINRGLGYWTIPHVLGLPEHSPPRFNASGLPVLVGMVSVGVISMAVALVWAGLDRRRLGYPRLFAWIHTFMRFMLGAIMLFYGWHKVLPAQFNFTFDYLTLPVGQHNPMDLLWASMGASRGYQVFTGCVEIAGGMLLLFRHTAMLGALTSMAAITNVLALDIAYDVPVMFLAGQLLLMSLFVLAPFAEQLLGLLLVNHETRGTPVNRLLSLSANANRIVHTLGLLFAVWIAYATFQAAQAQVDANRRGRDTPLYGIWDVEEMSRNGVATPLLVTDATLWRRVVVQSKDAAVFIPMSDAMPHPPNAGRYACRLDRDAHTIEFTPFRFSGAAQPMTFAYALPDPDHLVLSSHANEQTMILRLRRVDPSAQTLLSWDRSWGW